MASSNISTLQIAFIGGGNMASAIIGGLLKRGLAPTQIQVVEPFAEQAERLTSQFGVTVMPSAEASLSRAGLAVWAIKPQIFNQAAIQVRAHTLTALHLSVAAGIRSDSIARWLGTERVVRAMPNTPALIGQGMTALLARPAVTVADRQVIESVIDTTGAHLWLEHEAQLDAVTALSGSGPAYVFYFIEAMLEAGTEMGLDAAQARELAIATFVGASALAQASDEPPKTLRERVTSKGGTTYAALTAMEHSGVKQQFKQAMQAARERAAELGDEFGAD
ncbi:MAG: pyrroline-5-carboxylate reductase [Polaromonas sp.]|nr:pyrroline-5-carboxylate reductase [Polaromonas sp.]